MKKTKKENHKYIGFHNQKEYNQIIQKMNDRTINEYHGKY